jgi:hypothetical protein
MTINQVLVTTRQQQEELVAADGGGGQGIGISGGELLKIPGPRCGLSRH